MKIILANPRGFCAGVDRAIAIVEKALAKYGAPIYVRNEVVHNSFVVNNLKKRGVIFIKEIDAVPKNAVIIFSAHGVSQAVRKKALQNNRIVLDATCPLVTKIHKKVIRNQSQNNKIILIGHSGHPEVEGTLGQSNNKNNITLLESAAGVDNLEFNNNDDLSYTMQTTLSVDDTANIVIKLKQKYPNINSPKKNDICYATQNRQDAVKNIMQQADMLIVLGSKNSSNSNRLQEIALKTSKPSYLIDSADEIGNNWFDGVDTIGVTAGASAPEQLVQEVVAKLQKLGANEILEISGVTENVTFPIPVELR